MLDRFAATGTLKNAFVGDAPLARLTLGITGIDGKRVEMQFVRDEATTDLLVVQSPTERELDEQYLCSQDWERQTLEGIGVVWTDPFSGGNYHFESALAMQNLRDRQDMFAETPLEALYGGE